MNTTDAVAPGSAATAGQGGPQAAGGAQPGGVNPTDAQKDAGAAGPGAPTTMINTSGI